MKLEIDVKSEWCAPDPWARALEERDGRDPVGAAALASPAKNKNSRSKTQRVTALRVTRRYGMRPTRVFAAWLDPAVAGRWLFATASRPLAHVQIDGRVEG
jgi:hypothetical protein